MNVPNAVACPHCEGQIANDPQLAGQQVACPHCKRPLLMPATPVLPRAQPIAEESPAVEAAPFEFLESQQETPPPLPHEDHAEQSTVTQGANQYVRSATDFLGAITSGVKATAQMAAKKAQQTKLTTVDLSHAYLALGKNVYKERRLQEECGDLFAEIDGLVKQITSLKQAKPVVKGQTLTDKAKSVALDAKSAATVKTLEVKTSSLLRQLGKTAHDRFGADAGPQEVVQAVERLKAQIAEITSEVTQIGQTYRQNLNKKKLSLVPVVIGGGVIAFLGLGIIGAIVGGSSKKSGSGGSSATSSPDSSARASQLIHVVKDGSVKLYPFIKIGSAFDIMDDVRWDSFNDNDGTPYVSVSATLTKPNNEDGIDRYRFEFSVDPAQETFKLKRGNLNSQALNSGGAAIVLGAILKTYAERN